MKSFRIVRKVDELGRIVLPIELRRTLDINVRDELEISLDDDKVVLCKHEPTCVFCGSNQKLTEYRSKYICADCVREMQKEQ